MKSKRNKGNLLRRNSIFLWIALSTIVLLAVPFIAMQFTSQVVWTWFDFVVAGLLIFGTGVAFVLTARKSKRNIFCWHFSSLWRLS